MATHHIEFVGGPIDGETYAPPGEAPPVLSVPIREGAAAAVYVLTEEANDQGQPVRLLYVFERYHP